MAKRVTCPKCNGEGKLPHFMHIDNGRCFECAGAGKIDVDARPAPAPRPRDPAQVRQSFINQFRGALRRLAADGAAWLDEPVDSFTDRTEREQLRLALASQNCPADVRARAEDAFRRAGVAF